MIAAITVYAVAQGLTYPLLSFILERQGHSPGAIGLSAAMTPIGFICCAPFVPAIARRFGPATTVLGSAFTGAVVLALIGLTRDIVPWFPLRFLLGVIVLPLYIVSEVWIIELAPVALRGRVLGIYTSVISAGFALGPFTLILVGTESFAPFAGRRLRFPRLRLVPVRNTAAPAGVPARRGTSVLAQLPAARAGAALRRLRDGGARAGEPVAAAGLRASPRHRRGGMSALLGVLIAGNIALQVPIGLRRRALVGAHDARRLRRRDRARQLPHSRVSSRCR